MKLKKLLLIACTLMCIVHCTAQEENYIWAFGHNAGLDFNSGNATAISTGIIALEGTASVCDPQGDLLFYTQGDTIWNRNHEIMPDGILFPGRTTGLTFSTSQTAVIVPIPDNAGNRYYVFSLETNVTAGGRLYYSVVDMDLDNGLGNVVPGEAAIRLDSPSVFTEKMIAVAGENCDVWLVLKSFTDNSYKSYNITASGINPVPIVSGVGTLQLEAYRMGVIKASPDGKRIASASAGNIPFFFVGGTELYDFDPATGQLTNAIVISSNISLPLNYGLDFSPDGNKLYALYLDGVYQYNLDLPSTADIIASMTLIFTTTNYVTDLKRGPDGKIYFSALNHDSLHRIENPNVIGPGCNAVANALPLLPGTKAQHGFPNVVAVAPAYDTVYTRALDTIVCTDVQGGTLLELQITPDGYEWEWDNGSADTVRSITSAGTYWLYHKDRCAPKVDTFVVRGGYYPPLTISVNGDTLGTTATYDSWQWYRDGQPIPGANDSIYVVDTNGTYSVMATMANGCSDWDPDAYTVTNISVPVYAGMSGVHIYPNPARTQVTISTAHPLQKASVRLLNVAGQTLIHTPLPGNSVQLDISAVSPGIYIVAVEGQNEVIRVKMIKN